MDTLKTWKWLASYMWSVKWIWLISLFKYLTYLKWFKFVKHPFIIHEQTLNIPLKRGQASQEHSKSTSQNSINIPRLTAKGSLKNRPLGVNTILVYTLYNIKYQNPYVERLIKHRDVTNL